MHQYFDIGALKIIYNLLVMQSILPKNTLWKYLIIMCLMQHSCYISNVTVYWTGYKFYNLSSSPFFSAFWTWTNTAWPLARPKPKRGSYRKENCPHMRVWIARYRPTKTNNWPKRWINLLNKPVGVLQYMKLIMLCYFETRQFIYLKCYFFLWILGN